METKRHNCMNLLHGFKNCNHDKITSILNNGMNTIKSNWLDIGRAQGARCNAAVFFIFTFFTVTWVADASAAVRYVSPNGSGTACTNAAPCTFNQAITSLYNAGRSVGGDEILLKAGTYLPTSQFSIDIPANGTNRVTIKPAGAALSAIVDGTNTGENCINVIRPYVTIEGLEVRNCIGGNGIKVDGDLRGTSTSMDYNNFEGGGARNYHPNGADFVEIKNNYVHHVALDGIKINHTNNVLVEGNEIYKTGTVCATSCGSHQQGMDILGVYNATIRNNTIHDDIAMPLMSKGIFFKGGCENITVENNLIFSIRSESPVAIEVGGDTEPYNHRYTASNFPSPYSGGMNINSYILTQSYAYFSVANNYVPYEQYLAEARNSIIRGNIIYDTDYSISLRNAYNTKIYNNTFYDSMLSNARMSMSGHGVILWDDEDASHRTYGTRIYNNLFYNSTNSMTGAMYWDRGNTRGNLPCGVGFAADYNAIYNGGSSFTMTKSWHANDGSTGAHNITNNPLVGSDYRLRTGSPAIGAGVNLRTIGILGASETWTDRDGNVRSTQTDIGALLFASGDTSAPTVSLVTPANGTSVNGTINVTVSTTDNVGVTRVEYYVDGVLSSSINSAPFSWNWNTTTATNGLHSIYSVAYDAANNSGTSATVQITVANPDVTPPTVVINAPTNSSTVNGLVTVSLTANDNIGISRVELYVNGTIYASYSSAPYNIGWYTNAFANGNYTLTAIAYDSANNVGISANVAVLVNNYIPDTVLPTVTTFVIPAIASTQPIIINSFTANDNVGVTGYMITETSIAPLASDSGWSVTAPTTFTFSTAGIKTAYAWVKDAGGNVSLPYPGQSCTIPLQNAYDSMTGSGVIKLAGNNLPGSFTADKPVSVVVQSENSGNTTTVNGKVTVKAGKVTFNKIVLR